MEACIGDTRIAQDGVVPQCVGKLSVLSSKDLYFCSQPREIFQCIRISLFERYVPLVCTCKRALHEPSDSDLEALKPQQMGARAMVLPICMNTTNACPATHTYQPPNLLSNHPPDSVSLPGTSPLEVPLCPLPLIPLTSTDPNHRSRPHPPLYPFTRLRLPAARGTAGPAASVKTCPRYAGSPLHYPHRAARR